MATSFSFPLTPDLLFLLGVVDKELGLLSSAFVFRFLFQPLLRCVLHSLLLLLLSLPFSCFLSFSFDLCFCVNFFFPLFLGASGGEGWWSFCFCGGFCRCFEVDDDCGFVAISHLLLGSIGGVLGMLACCVFFFVLLWVFLVLHSGEIWAL